MRRHVVCLLITASFGVSACEEVEAKTSARDALLKARAAAEAYGAAVPSTYELQQSWVDIAESLQTPRAASEVKAIVLDKLLPALESYQAALATLPTTDAAIEKAHQQLVDAHQALAAGYRTFADGLTAETFAAQREALGGVLQRFQTAQSTYATQLGEQYEAWGLELTFDPYGRPRG